MRLNRFNPGSINVRRGGGGGLPGGRGGIGCGAIVIALAAAYFLGADPGQMLGTLEQMQGAGQTSAGEQQANETDIEICDDNQYSMESCNALGSLNETWAPIFARDGLAFRQPTLVFYSGGARSGCGAASSAAGPFYCPSDEGVYIDTSFYDQMARQLGAPGDFARYYVMAHEYGHHIQHVTGLADQVRSLQQQNPSTANALQVRMELQADCYAGIWAAKNRHLIEPGDMEEGLTAAGAIGDDTLQRNAGARVNPENFTHGSSAERMRWLRIGLETGDDNQCDTFADLRS
jgi:hypothetical protein